jgi:hypothetical protein
MLRLRANFRYTPLFAAWRAIISHARSLLSPLRLVLGFRTESEGFHGSAERVLLLLKPNHFGEVA